jgi:hypothetical protein
MSYTLRNKVAEYGGLTLTERYILETLALYANDDGTSCHPSLDRVAYDAGCNRKTVWEVIRDLRTKGVLIVVRAEARRPVDYRIVLASLPRREPFGPAKRRTRGGEGPPPDVEARGGRGPTSWRPEAASGGGRGPLNPVSNPVNTQSEGAAAPLALTDEGFVKAVVACWRAAREKAGIFKFIDEVAIKNLKDAARGLYAEAIRIDDVRKGIVEHADEPNANPWRGVREWASEARGRREALEEHERRMRDRAREDAEWKAAARR